MSTFTHTEQEMNKQNNPDFISMIKKKFPDTETCFIVCCGNGKKYSIDVLEALDEAGYSNTVLLRGGFLAWTRTWDNKLNRRVYSVRRVACLPCVADWLASPRLTSRGGELPLLAADLVQRVWLALHAGGGRQGM